VYDADASTLCRLLALAIAPAVAILWLAARQFGLDERGTTARGR
jgi:hypothetical protein